MYKVARFTVLFRDSVKLRHHLKIHRRSAKPAPCGKPIKGIKLCRSGIYNSDFFWSKLRNREEFEGGLQKRKGKGGKRRKKEKSDKTHVKIPL